MIFYKYIKKKAIDIKGKGEYPRMTWSFKVPIYIEYASLIDAQKIFIGYYINNKSPKDVWEKPFLEKENKNLS